MNVSRLLITLAVLLVAIGLLWPAISKLGRLPGDIGIRRDPVGFYAPITTCLILSLIVWIFWR